jgi:hypothetical protein
MPTNTTISTLTHEKTLGPLTNAQRQEIMSHATTLSPTARPLLRRLLILAQERGLDGSVIARAAAQAQAHMAGVQLA